jgi:arylsulfatase A-like enzyme
MDTAIGSIRKELQRYGLAENMIIVYSADYGNFNGEHSMAGKWYAHEESIRIPLIIYDPRSPGSLRGTRRKDMILNIDLHPTVLEMANLNPSKSAQGWCGVVSKE